MTYKRDIEANGIQKRYVTPEDKKRCILDAKKIGIEAAAEKNNVNVGALYQWARGKAIGRSCTTAFIPKELRETKVITSSNKVTSQMSLFEKKPKREAICLNLDVKLKQRLSNFAKERKISTTQVITRLIENFFTETEAL